MHSHLLTQYNAIQVLRRLLREHVKPYSKPLSCAIFFMVIVASCSAIIVKLVEPAIDKVFLTHDRVMLVILPLIMVGVYSLKGIAEYYQSYLIKYVGQRILTDLQMRMYSHLLAADWSFIQSQSSGRLISRFTNDISLMRGAVSNLLVGCAKHFLSVLFLIIVMFRLEPVLSLIVFVAFPIAVYPVQQLGRRIRKISTAAQEELGNYTARLDETFQSIRIIKSFATEAIEVSRAQQITNNILNFYKKTAKFDALTSPIMEILSGLSIGGIVWYGGLMIIEGKTTPGALFAFITAFVSAYRPFKSLLSLNINLQEGIAAAKRVFHILDISPTIADDINAKTVNFTNTDIIFKNIQLKFDKKIALRHLNLKLEQAKITSIIGRSGSGKTSLANLLVRFYDPDVGQILIGGHDLKGLTINCLRKQIALVTQETILFDATIAENIAYGQENVSEDQIIAAAKLADADEFITNLPGGYNAVIGTQGTTLSGGQRQRLAIARAILKDAPILVLDEATSALDPSSEQRILNMLAVLRGQGKTIIIITHRLSSITFVDNIIVMKSGKLIEQGTHELLLAAKGEYYKLYHKELEEDETTLSEN
ncbi:ABC transporter ATP-binding/permease protein [Candidatus Trichorickettsia mobilis]|uniref:ABC transporter ATP-binding/permease protein n=2 Tax=Candidatus Trichorickettsia mobilis TaxID=1346319 RepID=A0ABZ0UQL0_9RICK|nr:ABC transporter ATP-binding/permease protein [Candidatus Trichorickettsia mobilis]